MIGIKLMTKISEVELTSEICVINFFLVNVNANLRNGRGALRGGAPSRDCAVRQVCVLDVFRGQAHWLHQPIAQPKGGC